MGEVSSGTSSMLVLCVAEEEGKRLTDFCNRSGERWYNTLSAEIKRTRRLSPPPARPPARPPSSRLRCPSRIPILSVPLCFSSCETKRFADMSPRRCRFAYESSASSPASPSLALEPSGPRLRGSSFSLAKLLNARTSVEPTPVDSSSSLKRLEASVQRGQVGSHGRDIVAQRLRCCLQRGLLGLQSSTRAFVRLRELAHIPHNAGRLFVHGSKCAQARDQCRERQCCSALTIGSVHLVRSMQAWPHMQAWGPSGGRHRPDAGTLSLLTCDMARARSTRMRACKLSHTHETKGGGGGERPNESQRSTFALKWERLAPSTPPTGDAARSASVLAKRCSSKATRFATAVRVEGSRSATCRSNTSKPVQTSGYKLARSPSPTTLSREHRRVAESRIRMARDSTGGIPLGSSQDTLYNVACIIRWR